MRIKKTYETIINLSATEMYSDIDAVIMERLKRYFEGKCVENSFITSITDIKRRSLCKMSRSQLDGSGSVNVQYVAEAITYHQGDILSVCEIVSIEKNHQILCHYGEHVLVRIQGYRGLQTLKPGQKIPVLVRRVAYGNGQDKIIIYGVTYTYPIRFLVYALADDPKSLSADDAAIIQAKLSELETERTAFEGVNRDVKQFFLELYYPFKEKKRLPKGISNDMATAFVPGAKSKLGPGMRLCRHLLIEKSTDEVAILPPFSPTESKDPLLDEKIYKYEVVTESSVIVFLALIDDNIKFMRLIRELAAEFSTEPSRAAQKNIWDLYRSIKRS